jgi:hypothetical protein
VEWIFLVAIKRLIQAGIWEMMKFKIRSVVIACLLVQGVITTSQAQDTTIGDSDKPLPPGAEMLETGPLKNTIGYRGDVLGAEVISVETAANEQSELIKVSIPLDLEHDQFDQVSVFSSTGQRIIFDKPLEISMDYKNNKVGIIMSLPKKANIGFVIRLIDLPDE